MRRGGDDMNKKRLIMLISSVLVVCMLILTGCNNESETRDTESNVVSESEGILESECETEDETTGESETGTTQESEDQSMNETATEETTEEFFENGDDIENAGNKWYEDAFAGAEHSIDESAAREISAAELAGLMKEDKLSAGEVYLVKDPIIFESDTKYYANGAAVIAEGGVLIEGLSDVVIKELLVKGEVTVKGSSNIILFKLDVMSDSCGIKVDSDSKNVAIKSCRINAAEKAIFSEADETKIYQCYLNAPEAADVKGDMSAIQDCYVIGVNRGISADGYGFIMKNNTVDVAFDGEGIVVSNSTNALVALNKVVSVQRSIVLSSGYNCSVILNSAIKISVDGSTNVYVIDNKLGGRAELKNNNYIIADGNTCPSDGKNHSFIDEGNVNKNGDNITDVNARAEVGANEELTPHTNKDLFVGMERASVVRDLSVYIDCTFVEYINECIASKKPIILPPGAYSVDTSVYFKVAAKDQTVYAYGVYEEFSNYGYGNFFEKTKGITLKGLTVGYTGQSAGQVYILEKLGEKQLKVITCAGYVNDFGITDLSMFFQNGQISDVYRAGNMFCDTGLIYTGLEKQDDGTMIMTINALEDYSMLKAGDLICCRLAGGGGTTFSVKDSSDIKFEDIVTYGHAGAILTAVNGKSYDVSMERWHNTTHNGYLIDEETYERYKALESEFGVDLEVYIDGLGRYRGGIPRIGSIDATHILGTKEGVDVTSSIFENMCDDGSNQRSANGRLHNVVDNGDGTSTIYYKDSLAEWYALHSKNTWGGLCQPFEKGDRIHIYGPDGAVFCDTAVLSSSVECEKIDYNIPEATRTFTATVYKVTVKTDELNFEAICNSVGDIKYDLSDNHYSMANKVMVDNLSRNSGYFTFDNVVIQNIRSCAIRLKTIGAQINNCTFRNIGMGVLMYVETEWGESTVAMDNTINACLFDHTGYLFGDHLERIQAPVSIVSLSTVASEETLPVKNITVDGCKFINIENGRFIYVNSANGVKITNNKFDYSYIDGRKTAPYAAIEVDTAMNIFIEGNTVPEGVSLADWIKATNYHNIFGKDVTDENGEKLFSD